MGEKATYGFLWEEGRVKGRGVRRVGMVRALTIFSDKAQGRAAACLPPTDIFRYNEPKRVVD